MDWKKVCAWLLSLDVNEESLEIVKNERVPGSQIMNMTVEELVEDLRMTKLQALRVAKRTKSPQRTPLSVGVAEGGTLRSVYNIPEPDKGEDPIIVAGAFVRSVEKAVPWPYSSSFDEDA